MVLILFDPLLLDETKSAGGISEKRVLGTFSLMTRPKSKCVMLRSIGTSGGMRSPAARVLSLLLELTPLYNVKLASSYAAWRGGGGGAAYQFHHACGKEGASREDDILFT